MNIQKKRSALANTMQKHSWIHFGTKIGQVLTAKVEEDSGLSFQSGLTPSAIRSHLLASKSEAFTWQMKLIPLEAAKNTTQPLLTSMHTFKTGRRLSSELQTLQTHSVRSLMTSNFPRNSRESSSQSTAGLPINPVSFRIVASSCRSLKGRRDLASTSKFHSRTNKSS